MKLYLAIRNMGSNNGSEQDILGVFSTHQKAINCLQNEYNFEKYEYNEKSESYVYWFDGDLVFSLFVIETELDKEIANEENNSY